MQVLLQVLVSLTQYTWEGFFIFMKTSIWNIEKRNLVLVLQEKQLENKYAIDRGSNVCGLFLIKRQIRSNKIRIESARVRGSNKDGRDVFLAIS